MGKPRITFGIIVLNGEPFTRYNLRSLYPFAHQIIVVEGACRAAASIATADGHSIDGTLDALRKFKAEEDPEDKVWIVTATDEGFSDGFWPEKDEMSQAYARRATGNYLWQVDSDEFYLENDMLRIIKLLEDGVDALTFPTLNFWGDLCYITDGLFPWFDNTLHHHRLFAWGKDYKYTTHRPPTVVDENGVDTRTKRWIRSVEMRKAGIFLYHYTLLFPKQVDEKCKYYSKVAWTDRIREANRWAQEVYMALKRPYRVARDYATVSWLERYNGSHPAQAMAMMKDVKDGVFADVILRDTQDVERLLRSFWYKVGIMALKAYRPLFQVKLALRILGARIIARSPLQPVWRRLKKPVKKSPRSIF